LVLAAPEIVVMTSGLAVVPDARVRHDVPSSVEYW